MEQTTGRPEIVIGSIDGPIANHPDFESRNIREPPGGVKVLVLSWAVPPAGTALLCQVYSFRSSLAQLEEFLRNPLHFLLSRPLAKRGKRLAGPVGGLKLANLGVFHVPGSAGDPKNLHTLSAAGFQQRGNSFFSIKLEAKKSELTSSTAI
jgi:hypothetical protein